MVKLSKVKILALITLILSITNVGKIACQDDFQLEMKEKYFYDKDPTGI